MFPFQYRFNFYVSKDALGVIVLLHSLVDDRVGGEGVAEARWYKYMDETWSNICKFA